MSHRSFILSLALIISLTTSAQSVLSSGDWYKIGVTETGLYKLDRNFLSQLGLPVNNLNPQTLKIYGNGGGGLLPQINSEPRAFDLIENRILAIGESDGSLDAGDYFLFYGRSPHKVQWSDQGLEYERNFYSDTTYYFVTLGGDNGLRIENQESESVRPSPITTYDDVIIHEVDDRNILRSGRRWFGESMSPASGLTLQFNYSPANLSNINDVRLTAMAQSQEACSIDVLVNDNTVGNLSLNSIPFGPGTIYTTKGSENTDVYEVNTSASTVNFKLQFNPAGTTSIAQLDHFEILLTRDLRLENAPLLFRSLASLANTHSTFQIQNGSAETRIWDVTNPTSPRRILHSAQNNVATFTTETSDLREFVAFSGSSFPAPRAFKKVPNQSIKSNVSLDGIIVSHSKFLPQAERLADFHRNHSGLDVAVVTVRQVYNEFSSGMQDVSAIRDYARYVYNEGGQLKYLLLFGDASFAYKEQEFTNTNFVPIYESRNSFSPIYSHSSDDYFGFLEDHEGAWAESEAGDHTMEIGVGRIPAKTLAEAKTVVDKIIRYSTSTATFGNWRNEITYVVDDGDANTHVQQAEDLIAIIEDADFNPRKLYLDAYEQVIEANAERSPSFKRELNESIQNGSLFLNYLGHGNEQVWMDEHVLLIGEIDAFTNFQRLPIFVTATCEFGRYDDPFQVSGAEKLLLVNQGAIALLTTTRPVFAHTNFVLNQAYHQSILEAGPGKDIRLGDIIKETKNLGLQGAVNRNFALLGDPMIRPAYPQNEIVLDQFQGDDPDTLSALSKQTISGKIMFEGTHITNFNGEVEIILFDIPKEKITRGQQSSEFAYTERDNVLFRGSASVVNGQFSHQFTLPKNISYRNEKGKISLYAWDKDLAQDAGGSSQNLAIGGTARNYLPDNTSPQLEVYLNEPGFKNGSVVGPGAMLIAHFSDDNGINISNLGFDRGITLDLNGETFELNDFYMADLDTDTKGTVLYPLRNLEPGRYTAIVKGTDTHNNPVARTVEFIVSNQPILQTFNFKAYPNPAKTFTRFSFEHDREGEPLVVSLIVYALNGNQALAKTQEVAFSSRAELITFDWSDYQLQNGLYAYKLEIVSQVDGARTEEFGRLVIRN